MPGEKLSWRSRKERDSLVLKRLRKPLVSWKRSTTIHFELLTAWVWRRPTFGGWRHSSSGQKVKGLWLCCKRDKQLVVLSLYFVILHIIVSVLRGCHDSQASICNPTWFLSRKLNSGFSTKTLCTWMLWWCVLLWGQPECNHSSDQSLYKPKWMSVSIGDLRPIGGNSCSVVRITTDQSVSIATLYWKLLQVTSPQISYNKLWSFSKSSYVLYLPHSRGPNSFGDVVLNIQGSETLFVRIWHLYTYNFGQLHFCYMDSRMITLIDCYTSV